MATSITTVQRRPGHHRLGVVVAVGAAVLLVGPVAAQSPSPSSAPSTPSSSPVPVASLGAAPSGYTWTRLAPPAGAGDVDVTASSVAADGTWVALAEAQFDDEDSRVWRLGPTDTSVGRTKLPKSGDAFPRSLIRLGDQLLVVGSGKTWSSSDGSAWKTAKNKLKGIRLRDSAGDGTRALILASTGGKEDMFVLSTSDGKAFTKTPIEAPVGKRVGPRLVALSPTGTVVVAGADLDQQDQGYEDPGYLWSSPDGVTFTPVTLPSDVKVVDAIMGLATPPSGIAMVASLEDGSTAIYTSPDGQAWTETFTTRNPVVGYSLVTVPASLGGGLLMIGDGFLYSSPDGVTWTETPTPEFEGVQNSFVTTGAVLPDGRIVFHVDVEDDTAEYGHASSVLVGTPQP